MTSAAVEGFQLPPRRSLSDFFSTQDTQETAKGKKGGVLPTLTREHKKGKCWTEEEHLAFLAGLKKLGKGNWRGISRYYVPTRTSTQIASHAQKYLQRITGATKRKSKFTEIEQQVHSSQLADNFQPIWPLPNKPATERTQSAPAGTPAGGAIDAAVPGFPLQQSRPANAAHVCRPTAVRATSSEPDLLKLAESLISLADVGRALSPSGTSAFKRANSGTAAPPSCSE